MPTSTYTAPMITRKYDSTLNTKETAAGREYYTDDYNFVGVISFPGMNPANRVISAIQLTAASAAVPAMFGANTVYFMKVPRQVTPCFPPKKIRGRFAGLFCCSAAKSVRGGHVPAENRRIFPSRCFPFGAEYDTL